MLAIICTLKKWRHFLEGAWYLVEIWTDHKNLEYFMMAKKLNCRQVLLCHRHIFCRNIPEEALILLFFTFESTPESSYEP